MVSMYNLNFSSAESRDDRLHLLADSCMLYATGQCRVDVGAETGITGNYLAKDGCTTTWWINRMVSMYNLNYSRAEPRDDQLHLLVDNCLSMLQSFSGQISCCLLKCWILLVEDKETSPIWY